MKTSQEEGSENGRQGCDKARAISEDSNRECESTSLMIINKSYLPYKEMPMTHLYACRSILAQVLELKSSIEDQMVTVKCMHEVMRKQQRVLCNSSNQRLISGNVENDDMASSTTEDDCSFYLTKTKEFQIKSDHLISKIWNVVRAYETSLSGSSTFDSTVNLQSTDDALEYSGSGHPEFLRDAIDSEPKAKRHESENFEKYLGTMLGKNTPEFHEKRAEFWECLAKCSINILNTMPDEKNVQNQKAKTSNGKDTVTIRRDDLNMFSIQIGDLSDDVQRLKKQSQDDGSQIQKLKEQNDRFHKALCARKEKIKKLENFLAKEKARNEKSAFTDESKELQAVIAQLRLSVETHRDRFVKAAAEKDVLKGHNEELMERLRRREEALKKAQDRCRMLESKKSESKLTYSHHKETCSKFDSSKAAIQQNVSQDAAAHCKHKLELEYIEETFPDGYPQSINIDSTLRKQNHTSIADGSDTLSSRSAVDSSQPDCENVMSSDTTPAPISQQINNGDSDTDDKSQEENFERTIEILEPFAPSAHDEPNHEKSKSLSNDPDMDTIRSALAKADDTILSCMQRIETLNESLAVSQDEAAKSQQMYASNLEELDTARRSLHASQSLILQLQKQLTDVQEASAAYHHQMDQMIMSEREDFAKESHLLSSQVQDLSNKLVSSQAKVLHQIQTIRKELEKAQAINRQLSTQILQKENVIKMYAMALGERKIRSLGAEPMETRHSEMENNDLSTL